MRRTADQEIYNLYEKFIEQFFLEKKNFFYDSGKEIFTKDNIDECKKWFIQNPDDRKETFDEKARRQFAPASEEAKAVFEHAVWLWGFSVNQSKNVQSIFSTNNYMAVRRVKHGFGNAGLYHLSRKYEEVCFILRLFSAVCDRIQEESLDYQGVCKLIENLCLCYKYGEACPAYEQYSQFDVVSEDKGKRAMTEILLYLSAPDHYERIVSYDHKQKIAKCFSDFPGLLTEDEKNALLDEKIKTIRDKLSQYVGNDFDFYDNDKICSLWNLKAGSKDYDEFLGLQFKKNIIFYGPPGTSKTYSARNLAESFVARRQLTAGKLTIQQYLDSQYGNQAMNGKYINKLQLHANYGYEQFIAGQTLKGDRIETVKGYFLIRCEEAEKDPDNPYVLILDEINRVDLAKVFGEAFSCIENRGEPIDLPFDDGDNSMKICVPENLYIIGTMNEIDFSLERLDFALRRRFLWYKHGFDSEVLRDMLEPQIAEDDREEFITRVEKLNREISSIDELGEQYEIGHTFFAEINKIYTQFSDRKLYTSPKNQNPKTPKEPVEVLWKISVLPMLESYLDNMDSERKKEIINKLENIYYGKK